MRAPEFWKHKNAAAILLAPLGALYGASVAWKARNAKPYRARAKVICVGNLTAGGSGKTPVAIAVATILIAQGRKVFFLTRGYGGQARGPVQVTAAHSAVEIGDEALLLARTAPTIVARERAAGARLADQLGAEIVVMDDGHQNFALAKDLSLVVVDGESGFGNDLMIPAGPLREPVAQGLARADAVIVMKDGAPDLGGYTGPLLRAHLQTQSSDLQSKRVFAFAGIGRPEKFVASLQEAGAIIAGTQFFADHHAFRPGEIAALHARANGAQLVTTEKDFVRLTAAEQKSIAVLKASAVFDNDIVPLLHRLFA